MVHFALLIFLSTIPLKLEAATETSINHLNALKCVRGCQHWGFFAEFFWALNHLQWCEITNKIPVIYWDSEFAYYSNDGYKGAKNCWEYYFEPVSELSYVSGDFIHRNEIYNDFSCIWWYKQYVSNLNLLSGEERQSINALPLPLALAGDDFYPVTSTYGHLYSKKLRKYVKSLIDKYVRPKSRIQKKINKFYKAHMRDHKVIGLHLRGKFIYNEVGEVPIDMLCEEANKLADNYTLFFIATDQIALLDQARMLLKRPVIAYKSYRQDITTSPVAPGQWPPEMGEQVLIETILLSKCDHIVHTISNVSTAALYFNPNLHHTMLYCAGGA